MEYGEALLKRFWDKVEKTDGCWLWTGGSNSGGYGQIKYKGAQQKAHRVSLSIALKRPILEGFEVAHAPVICHTRLCVNPQHLREATRIENQSDRILDGTHSIGKKGSLTDEQIRAIRSDVRPQRVIAADLKINVGLVSHIKSRKAYWHVADTTSAAEC